jgi:hypothetical protein
MPPTEHLALVVTWLFFVQPVAFGAKLVDLVEHPVAPKSQNLSAAVLNVRTNEIDVRHVPNSLAEQNNSVPEK